MDKQKQKIIAAISVAVIAFTTGTLVMLKGGAKEVPNTPPTIKVEGQSTLTGFISKDNEKWGMMQAETKDVAAYEMAVKGHTDIIDLQKGVNFLYLEDEATYDNVYKMINPKSKSGVLFNGAILTYDPKLAKEKNNLNEGWIEYPDAFYVGGKVAKGTDKIPAHTGIVLVSSIDTKAFGLKGYKEVLSDNPNSVCDLETGWNLVAMGSSKVDKIDCYDQIQYIWTNTKLQAPDVEPFTESYVNTIDKDTKLPKTKFTPSSFTGGSIHWMYIREKAEQSSADDKCEGSDQVKKPGGGCTACTDGKVANATNDVCINHSTGLLFSDEGCKAADANSVAAQDKKSCVCKTGYEEKDGKCEEKETDDLTCDAAKHEIKDGDKCKCETGYEDKEPDEDKLKCEEKEADTLTCDANKNLKQNPDKTACVCKDDAYEQINEDDVSEGCRLKCTDDKPVRNEEGACEEVVTCVNSSDRPIYNETTNTCDPCPDGKINRRVFDVMQPRYKCQTPVVCGENQIIDATYNKCVCKNGFHDLNMYDNKLTCVAITCDQESQQINEDETACECKPGFERDNSQSFNLTLICKKIECENGMFFIKSKNKCIDPSDETSFNEGVTLGGYSTLNGYVYNEEDKEFVCSSDEFTVSPGFKKKCCEGTTFDTVVGKACNTEQFRNCESNEDETIIDVLGNEFKICNKSENQSDGGDDTVDSDLDREYEQAIIDRVYSSDHSM